jgi:hypothetical protein
MSSTSTTQVQPSIFIIFIKFTVNNPSGVFGKGICCDFKTIDKWLAHTTMDETTGLFTG